MSKLYGNPDGNVYSDDPDSVTDYNVTQAAKQVYEASEELGSSTLYTPDLPNTVRAMSLGYHYIERYGDNAAELFDGTAHPLSEFFGSLGAAQAAFPHATSLSEGLAWAAFQGAINAAQDAGGGAIVAPGPSAVMHISTRLDVTSSDIVLAGNGAYLWSGSNVRMWFVGTKDDPLNNCKVIDWNIGLVNDANNIMAGPLMRWCVNGLMENIVKKGFSGTGFYLQLCDYMIARNLTNYGASTTNGAFGMLTHMTNHCVVDKLQVLDGAFVYGIQVKGGIGNIVQNSLVKNLATAGTSAPRIGFRARGDAPWKPSATSGLDYPFSTLDWDRPDPRRATIEAKFINCRVEEAPVQAFAGQEDVDTKWIDCSSDDTVTGGFFTVRLDTSTAASFATTLTVAAAGGATLLSVASTADIEEDDTVLIVLNSGVVHVATILAVLVGQLQIDSPLPSVAGIGKTVSSAYYTALTVAGITNDTSITVAATAGFVDGSPVIIALDNGSLHETTVDGTPSATVIELTDPLPSAAAIGKTVSQSVPGQERGVQIVRPKTAGTTQGYGALIEGASATYRYKGASIEGGEILASYLDGVRLDLCDTPKVHGLTSKNNGQEFHDTATKVRSGIRPFDGTVYPILTDNHLYDDQAVATQGYGILCASTILQPTIANNRTSGNGTQNINIQHVGYFSNNSVGEGSAQTTDATPNDAILRLTVEDGMKVWVEVTVIGEQGTTNYARYKLGGFYQRDGASVAIVGSVVTLETAIESNAAWNCELITSSDQIRVRVTGALAATVNWLVWATCWIKE